MEKHYVRAVFFAGPGKVYIDPNEGVVGFTSEQGMAALIEGWEPEEKAASDYLPGPFANGK